MEVVCGKPNVNEDKDARPIEKYFVSLNFPEKMQGWLAKAGHNIQDRLGDLVGLPMSPNKYHITLAVIQLPQPVDPNFLTEVSSKLVLRVEHALKDMDELLYATKVDKFGDGAVFLEIEGDALKYLRKTIVDYCDVFGLSVCESSCFHVTLFRRNQVEDIPHDLKEDYKSSPLSFGIGSSRLNPDDDSSPPPLMIYEVYHGKVKSPNSQAATRQPDFWTAEYPQQDQ